MAVDVAQSGEPDGARRSFSRKQEPEAEQMTDRVEVLLATRNSGDYLAEMLESLLAQSHDDFHLVISDDQSSDDTVEILESYAPRFRNPVQFLNHTHPSGSAMANFGRLLQQSSGNYVFLADHDDVWLADKISNALRDLKAAEARTSVKTPILYHSDLSVIDGKGQVTHPSYWAFKRLDPGTGERLGSALIQPVATGCAMAMNAALISKAIPIPQNALMHDWWLLLVASAFGEVLHESQPQILYRIHGGNASRPRQVGVFAALKQLDRIQALRRGLRRRVVQGTAFHERFGAELPSPLAEQAALFASLENSAPGVRQYKMLRGRIFGSDPLRNLVQLLLI